MSDLGDEDRDILQVFRKGGGGGGGACRAFEDLVDNMSKGRLEEFVGRMRHKAQDANDAFTHCKMLFSHKRTRGMAVLLCVELLQAGKLSDKAAFRCIPEIRAAIVDCAYVGGIGVGAGNACSEEEEAGERIDFLTRLCTDILGFLCQDDANNDHCDASGGGGGGRVQRRVPNDRNYGGSTSVENFVKALELLPAALQGLENQASPEAGNPAGRESSGDNRRVANGGSLNAAAVRTRIISETLGSSWPACCVLPLLRVLTEISLTESEKAQACRHVVDSSSEIPEEHTIGLIEVLLSYAEKYGDMRWLEAGRCVLERTPERLLGDAYCVVEISLHNGSRLMGLINSTLGLNDAAQDHRSRKSGDDHQHSAANEARLSQLTVTDFFLMLIVAQNDLFRERVMDTMIFELGTSESFPAGAHASSSPPSKA